MMIRKGELRNLGIIEDLFFSKNLDAICKAVLITAALYFGGHLLFYVWNKLM